MDSLYRTPLLDCFRRGEVPPDIRMLAAQGVLAPRAHEQLGLLVLLADDADPAIRAATESTLSRIPQRELARFLGRPDVAPDIHEFFTRRGVQPEPAAERVSDDPLLDAEAGAEAAAGSAAEERVVARRGDEPDWVPREATLQRLSSMTVSQKIKAAMRGSREERAILVRDPNRLVALAVLSSPKVSEPEVEAFAKMANVSEDALRVIGTTRAWSKNYTIVRALAFNPKSPISISMTLVNRLVEKDIRVLAMDRNIAEPVKILARKILQSGKSRRH
jgi:hypothetical protein